MDVVYNERKILFFKKYNNFKAAHFFKQMHIIFNEYKNK